MRILLDESLPKALGKRLVGHETSTVVDCGWSGIKNGKLLALAATKFDIFLTADQNIEYQQNVHTLPISIIILVALSNRIEAIDPLIGEILIKLKNNEPRTLIKVGN